MKNQSKRFKRFGWTLLALILLAIVAMAFVIDQLNIPPRQLAPYLERRADGHQQVLVDTMRQASNMLQQLDRGTTLRHLPQQWNIGAQAQAGSRAGGGANLVMVSTATELKQAINLAQAGQVITMMPGHYQINGDGSLEMHAAGKENAPITIRAERPGTVFVELNAGEGFKVSAPWWIVENLNIRGICQQQEFCEHAFHVVGKAAHFVARNNTVTDFNAHFKINGEDGFFPDFGLIEGNTLTNSGPRQTDSPVTPIDLVAASHWRIARNLISDFIKAKGDRVSYGAFVKGGGADNRIEQNIVLCEYMLQGNPGQQVGLSLGGGGTGPQYCRDRRCITEQDGGVIQANLIASCSDDGIYLNSAAASKIMHNTLVDTGGITARFAASTADVEGNLVDSVIRERDSGLLRPDENMGTSALRLYLGLHPVRDLFRAPAALDFNFRTRPPVRDPDQPVPDLCGSGTRSKSVSYGAFEDFSGCAGKQQK
jgi:hypothetical protein